MDHRIRYLLRNVWEGNVGWKEKIDVYRLLIRNGYRNAYAQYLIGNLYTPVIFRNSHYIPSTVTSPSAYISIRAVGHLHKGKWSSKERKQHREGMGEWRHGTWMGAECREGLASLTLAAARN